MEKIMKAVKSGNKKRGRNITIGAVVGMLLSCTVAMGEEAIGLDITKNGDEIEFSKDGKKFDPGIEGDPYPENTWEDNTYTNNTTISGESENGEASGVKLSEDLDEMSFINKGTIAGTSKNSKGYGIYNNENSTIGILTNKGTIAGTTNGGSGSGYGIHNSVRGNITIGILKNKGTITGTGTASESTGYGIYTGVISITELENNGTIAGTSSGERGAGYGIHTNNSTIEELTNNGSIIGKVRGNSGYGYGIYTSDLTMTKLENNGIIAGTIVGTSNEGYGINLNYTKNIATLTNTGVIYGKTNAIYKDARGSISSAYNYGLLVSGDKTKNVVDEVTIVAHDDSGENKISNYGLAFIADSSSDDNKYIGVGSDSSTDSPVDYHNDFGKMHQNVSIDGVSYDIINVGASVEDASKEITDWKSLTLEEGKLTYYDSKEASDKEESISSDKQYILNGIEDTLKVSGENNELNNSVVNAYKTAVVMNGESSLTLDNTVVNGGTADGSTTVNITGEGNNFTAKGNSVINTGDEGTAITVDGDKNTVTLEGNTIVNGKMSASGEKNTLNLYGKQNMTKSNDNENMNILHDIEGFGRIQIENNVTFFEDIKVTGVERLNINKGGTLSLRLKAGEKSGDKATHALKDHATGANDSTLLIAGKEEGGSETAGTLNFITNGMGKGAVIDMRGIELENVYLRANSILYDLKVVEEADADANVGDIKLETGASLANIYNERKITPDPYVDGLPDEVLYNSLNKIYKSSVAVDDNVDAITDMIGSASDEEQWEKLLTFLGSIYTESPYSYSSELSRRSVGMFRDIITENEFRPNLNNWLIMGGLTHADGGTKDTYYGHNYYEIDNGSSSTNADMKLTGAYMLAKYGYSEDTSLGLTLGGNKSEAKLSMSKVKGNSGYIGAFAENYKGNLTLKAGAGIQYSEYDADRRTIGGHSYSDKYSDMTYDIYLNGRYSHIIGKDLFLEPYATLSYTYVDQDGANEGSKDLAIETDSKSFDYTVAKAGVDLKKVIPHEKGKSTVSAGVSYTKILDGANEEHITGRFKGGSDFDILVAHKNEHSVGLNAKYALELENGVLFDVKGTYSVERDSHNQSGKNKTKGEWIVGVGIGYKF